MLQTRSKLLLTFVVGALVLGRVVAQQPPRTTLGGTPIVEIPAPPPLDLTIVSPAAAPDVANYFSAGHEWPPLPFNPFAAFTNVPIYYLQPPDRAGGLPFLMFDDRAVITVEELEQAAAPVSRLSTQSSSLEFPGDGEGGSETNESSGYFRFFFATNDLWLELDPLSLTNGTGNLLLHVPDNLTNEVWDVFGTTNLALDFPGLNGTNWAWVARTGAGETNLTVPLLSDYQSYYRLADITDTDTDGLTDAFEALVSHSNALTNDTDGDGLLDGWAWTHFGSVYGSAANLTGPTNDFDGDTISNLDEQSAGSDPNTIAFALSVTNQFIKASAAPMSVAVLGGVPAQMAILVDSTNWDSATWTAYSGPGLSVDLGGTQGWHVVRVGLRGRSDISEPTWHALRVKTDTIAPGFTVTTPGPNVSIPMIQLQGFCNESLATICYTMNDVTNGRVIVLDQSYSTNTLEFTTNFWQAFDLDLLPGTNHLTLTATDRAGNVGMTNLQFILAPDTNAPGITLTWPQPGLKVGGDTLTVRGRLGDPTAQITASVTDTNGATNLITGLVERDGKFWIENVPLQPGTNWIELTAVDAWTNSATTNFPVIRSGVSIGITPVDESQLWNGAITVSGTVTATNYAVWANGHAATVNPDGSWSVDGLNFGLGGTASITVTAYPPGEEPGSSDGETNPTTANSASTELNQDKPSHLFVRDVQQLDSYQSTRWETSEVEGAPDEDNGVVRVQYQQHYQHQWAENEGGNGWGANWQLNEIWDYASNYTSEVFTNSIRSVWGPDNLGTQISMDEYGNVSTNVIGQPSVWYEHCDVNDPKLSLPVTTVDEDDRTVVTVVDTYERHADTAQTLYTGSPSIGRNSIAHEECLWEISITATEITNSRSTAPYSGLTIPSEQIEIGTFGKPDSFGKLYVVLPDGTNVVVTPHVPGKTFFSYTLLATRFQLIHTTVHPALTDTNLTRKKVGVAEEVDFEFSPALSLPIGEAVSWSASCGELTTDYGFSTTWTAPSNATNAAVFASVRGAQLKTSFVVKEPNGYDFAVIDSTFTNSHAPGIAAAAMHLNVYVAPTDVCLYKVQVAELPGPATNIWGYYANTNLFPPGTLDHTSAGSFSGYLTTSNVFGDKVVEIGDPQPWTNGGFSLQIPAVWKIGTGPTNLMKGWDSTTTISASGTVTIVKFKQTVTRTTNNVIVPSI